MPPCTVRAAQAQSRPTLTLHATSHTKNQSEAESFPENNDSDSPDNPLCQEPKAPKTRSMTQGQIPRRGILTQQTQKMPLNHTTTCPHPCNRCPNKTPTMNESHTPCLRQAVLPVSMKGTSRPEVSRTTQPSTSRSHPAIERSNHLGRRAPNLHLTNLSQI